MKSMLTYYKSNYYENLTRDSIPWCYEGRTEDGSVATCCGDCINSKIDLCQCVLDDYLAYMDDEGEDTSC